MSDEFELAAEVDELRRALARQQRATRKARSKTEMLVEAGYQAATDAQLAIGRVSVSKPPARDRRRSAGEVALVHATDYSSASRLATTRLSSARNASGGSLIRCCR